MQRRLALLFMFAAVADAEAGRLIRGTRSGSPPPPPPPPPAAGIVPTEPFFVQVTSQSAGSVSIAWQAPAKLFNGTAISGDPVVSYAVSVRRTDSGAQVGTATATAPTLSATVTGLPATTMRAYVTATNSIDASEESHGVEWVGT